MMPIVVVVMALASMFLTFLILPIVTLSPLAMILGAVSWRKQYVRAKAEGKKTWFAAIPFVVALAVFCTQIALLQDYRA
jgi:hypothetical protein